MASKEKINDNIIAGFVITWLMLIILSLLILTNIDDSTLKIQKNQEKTNLKIDSLQQEIKIIKSNQFIL